MRGEGGVYIERSFVLVFCCGGRLCGWGIYSTNSIAGYSGSRCACDFESFYTRVSKLDPYSGIILYS